MPDHVTDEVVFLLKNGTRVSFPLYGPPHIVESHFGPNVALMYAKALAATHPKPIGDWDGAAFLKAQKH